MTGPMSSAFAVVASVLLSMLAWGVLTRRWSAAARAERRHEPAAGEPRLHPLMRIPVPWTFVLAYLAGWGAWRLVPRPPGAAGMPAPLRLAGYVPLAIGVAIAFAALRLFKRAGTTTVPFARPTTLVFRGPYRFSRNPMYLGLALVHLGVAVSLGQLGPLLALPPLLVYLDRIVIPVEERHLTASFGEAYVGYRARVGRWLGVGPRRAGPA